MKFNVFNKKPSKEAIKSAMSYSNIQEQMETLAQSTSPEKGEIWENETGRILLIRSEPMPIQGIPLGSDFADCYGVIVADIISSDLKTNFDIFFPLNYLLGYRKIGKK